MTGGASPDQVAASFAAALWSAADRSPRRWRAIVAGLRVVSLGLPQPWANAVVALERPAQPAAVSAGLAVLDDRGVPRVAVIRERDAGRLPECSVVEVLPAYAAPTALPLGASTLLIGRPGSAVEFRAVYAASFGMPPGQAEQLVVEADLSAPGFHHVVGRAGDDIVAVALLRVYTGLGYLNGLGVLPEHRRRGYGTAMLAGCARLAGELGAGGMWLHAAESARGFYERLGFRYVDTHLQVA